MPCWSRLELLFSNYPLKRQGPGFTQPSITKHIKLRILLQSWLIGFKVTAQQQRQIFMHKCLCAKKSHGIFGAVISKYSQFLISETLFWHNNKSSEIQLQSFDFLHLFSCIALECETSSGPVECRMGGRRPSSSGIRPPADPMVPHFGTF